MQDKYKWVIWIICATLWATICFVVPDFADNPVEGLHGFLSQTAYICACAGGVFFLIYTIACNRYLCAIFLPIFGIMGAAVSFYRSVYHVTITPMIIEATLHTNLEEASGVMSWQLILWVLINLSIAILFCWTRIRFIELPRAWIHASIALVLGLCYFYSNGRLRNGICQRYPYNIPYNIHLYRSLHQASNLPRITPKFTVYERPDSLTIVLFLGEAVRADHIQLNGYERETTPLLAARSNIISCPNIYSEQTHTLASLPVILTRADSIHNERQYTEHSFVSIFHKEGYRSAWISNQDIGSTFAPFIAECDTAIYVNAGKSVYVFSPWLDEEMLPVLDTLEKTRTAHELYIFHPIGSHWYYNNHVPESQWYFQPVTTNRLVSANSLEQIMNSYDNTIRYMDFVVNATIQRMENKNALIIFQSDHGEALGEEGEYLHANDTEMAKHPACIIWYSELFATNYPDKIKALVANKDKRYRIDYLFYSILSAAGVEAEGDNPDMNIFR